MTREKWTVNKNYFHLSINDDNAPITAASFSITNIGLGQHYSVVIKLHSREYLHLPQYLEKRAKFIIDGFKKSQTLYGYLTDLEGPINNCPFDQGIYEWKFVLESPLFLLRKKKRSRAFRNMSVDEIVRQLFAEYNFSHDDYFIDFIDIYPKRPLTVQYCETDLTFFQRILEHYGLFYRFNNEGRLVIIDDISRMNDETVELPFQFLTGQEKLQYSVFKISTTQNLLLPKIVTLNDYNADTPNLNLFVSVSQQANFEVKSAGEDYRYGENYRTLSEGKQLAKIRMQSYDWRRKVITLQSDCPILKPGLLIKLINAPAQYSKNHYRIINLAHCGNQTDECAYYNTVTCIPADVPYRAPVTTVKPRGGFGVGAVEALSKDYCYSDMDSHGNVWMRFDFDTDDVPSICAGPSIRIMQPLSGEGKGYYFSLKHGTKVLYACINGDVDRPVIIGVIPTSAASNPVTSHNAWEHIIRTGSGNTLYMNDQQREETFALLTHQREQCVTLSNLENDHKIRLSSMFGDINIQAESTQTFLTKGEVQQTVGRNQTIAVQGQHQIISEAGNIDYQVQDSYQKALENFMVQSEGKMQIKGSIVHCDAQEAMRLNAKTGHVHCTAQQGKFVLETEKKAVFISEGKGDMVISQPNAQFILKKDGTILIKANIIHFKAQQSTHMQSG